ncbi:MAG: Ku protein [Planctomyces sp.]|nr:Ku protein [Planctomyces sp.]
MPRPIWKGHISFGLVNVPVTLYGAEQRNDISFHLLDSRDSARVRYERVNEATGEEVPWSRIIKGYEYADGNYVLLKEQELERAQAELTKTIEIEQFVDLAKIEVPYFDKPYVLTPSKGGEKGYVLLRETMRKTGRAGIARVVIRARGYVAALLPVGDALILNLLRFHQELKPLKEFDLPRGNSGRHKATPRELELAKSLVDGMSSDWNPEDYDDEHREALMRLIRKRIDAGQTESAPEDDLADVDEPPATVNFLDVLKQSVATKSKGTLKQAANPGRKSKPRPRTGTRPAGKKRAPSRARRPAKKKAG